MSPDPTLPPMVDIGAAVHTANGGQIGTVKDVSNGAFRVDASLKPDFWLNAHTVMRSENHTVTLGVEQEHLNQFKSRNEHEASELDAIQILLEMHGEARAKFRDILGSDDRIRAREVWETLMAELAVHEQMEEMHLYHPLEQDEGVGEELRKYDDHHEGEANEVNNMIARTTTLYPGSAEWRDLIATIHDTLTHHMAEEESDIFPRIRETWTEERLREAGRAMLAMKREKLAS